MRGVILVVFLLGFSFMKKIQCTFRLPVEVVKLIDGQHGETRTDKLLSLLGFESNSSDYSVMQSAISGEVEERFLALESRISELEKANNYVSKSSKMAKRNAVNSSYEDRSKEVVERCRAAWLSLSEEQRQTITKKDFAELSGASRGTVTKYWSIFTADSEI